jgi:EAL domain-containing protein (putative c-di-GMP-specific phosphodiesterase class I)
MLRKWGYPANRLTLEITENAILVDPTHAMEMVAQIADLGVKVSIDDFGTGYSSLAYLKNLAVHELKIDKSFVLSMTENASDRTIVKSVISLAHDLGLTVVAEGIETPGSLSILEEFGCDTGQGYLFGRPMPASNFENLVRSEQSGKAGHPKVEAKGADGEDCRVISMVGARDRSRSTDSNDT